MTSTGRKSGEPRTIPIIFTQYGDSWVIMASKGGAPKHPAWYLNVSDDPNIEVQVKADVWEAKARTAESPEREKIWAEALRVWPSYEIYQSRHLAEGDALARAAGRDLGDDPGDRGAGLGVAGAADLVID